jgi:hypothetical protein
VDLLHHWVKIIYDCYTKISELIVERYDDHVHDPIEWKDEDKAVAGDTVEETRCSASHDRGHLTV